MPYAVPSCDSGTMRATIGHKELAKREYDRPKTDWGHRKGE